MSIKTATRATIPAQYKWNLDLICKNPNEFHERITTVRNSFTALSAFNGKLSTPAALFSCLNKYFEINEETDRLFVYAYMKHTEDTTEPENQALHAIAHKLYSDFQTIASFIEPEILNLGSDTIVDFMIDNHELKLYEQYLKNIFRKQPHILTTEAESVIAALSGSLSAANDVYTMLSNADMYIGTIKDKNGNYIKLTHANYKSLQLSKDRDVRKNSNEAYFAKYKEYKNTLTTALSSSIKTNVSLAKIRNYNSAVENALSEDNIPTDVYHSLLSAVHDHLPTLHRYYALCKKLLKLDTMYDYDKDAPIVDDITIKFPYEEAKATILESLSPLGEEYVNIVKSGFENGWVDVYENTGKQSGAFAFGSYGTQPYVSLNYQDEGLKGGISTLAHELGHAMHFYYTWDAQPNVYSHYTMFLAEVASTVNELLLIKHLQNEPANVANPATRAYFLNEQIKLTIGTVFRQAMFAEFELETHGNVEEGKVLTLDSLNEIYGNLYSKYHGNAVTMDDNSKFEWARVPHFYRDFYVYQYATGYLIAESFVNSLTDPNLEKQKQNRGAYINFLKRGSSDYTMEILKTAGVDISTPAVFTSALDNFDKLVNELESLLS